MMQIIDNSMNANATIGINQRSTRRSTHLKCLANSLILVKEKWEFKFVTMSELGTGISRPGANCNYSDPVCVIFSETPKVWR
jgi:hypothetical protein